MRLGALQVIASEALVIGPFEDWSQVRSPSRAARRRRQGHPQRIRLFYKPDPDCLHDVARGVIYAHPATIAQLERETRKLDDEFLNGRADGNPWPGILR